VSYKFARFVVGRFKVHKSSPLLGDEHKKRFVVAGVTPYTQETLNIYSAGVFRFDIAEVGFSQEMTAGDTNLSLALAEFPINVVCVESVVSATAQRYCVAPTVAAPWQQSVIDLVTGELLSLPVGACVFVVSGSISSAGASVGIGQFFTPSSDAVALESSRVVVAK